LIYLQNSQFDKAVRALQQAPGSHRFAAEYLLGLGHLQRRNLDDAVRAFEASVAADPAFFDAYFALARAYRLSGRPEHAAETYQEVIRRDPSHLQAHFELAGLYKYLMDSAAFQRMTMEASRLERPAFAGGEKFLAFLREQEENLSRLALAEFGITLRLTPLHFPAVRQIAEIYRRSGELRQARAIFAWLCREQPGNWLVLYRLGSILVQLGEVEEAIQTLRKAVLLSPAQADPYVSLGLAYLKAGEVEEAIAACRKGLVYEPFNPAFHVNLGSAYARRGAYRRAQEHWQRAIELGTFPLPELHLPYTNLGLAALRQGKLQEAERYFNNALYIFPDYPLARAMLRATQAARNGGALSSKRLPDFVLYEKLEIFGEITTAEIDGIL
jgi:tetratricopeptide (TPR) repeat protein